MFRIIQPFNSDIQAYNDGEKNVIYYVEKIKYLSSLRI